MCLEKTGNSSECFNALFELNVASFACVFGAVSVCRDMLPAAKISATMLVLVLVFVMVVMVQLWNLSSFTRFFIAVYNILFASLLILHESQVRAN